jgi:hypothetical protein
MTPVSDGGVPRYSAWANLMPPGETVSGSEGTQLDKG